jgi:hypothetical protein
MGFVKKIDGLRDGAITFATASIGGLRGHDLGVLLRLGAGEIDFGQDLL